MVREVFQGTISCLPLHTVGPNLSIIKKVWEIRVFRVWSLKWGWGCISILFHTTYFPSIFESSKPTLRIFSKSFVFALFLWSLSKKVISVQQCIVQPFSKNWHISAFFHFYVWAQKPILRKIEKKTCQSKKKKIFCIPCALSVVHNWHMHYHNCYLNSPLQLWDLMI